MVGVHGRVGEPSQGRRRGGTQSHTHTHTHTQHTNTNAHMGWMKRGGRGKEKPRLAMAGACPPSRVLSYMPCTVHDMMMIMMMIKTLSSWSFVLSCARL